MSVTKTNDTSRQMLAPSKRVVVKVGSSLLTGPDNGLQVTKIDAYATQIAKLAAMGHQVTLVSSGAVAAGCLRLGWSERPHQVHLLQAAASVGQMGLVQSYESTLRKYGCGTAMIMLTHDDLADRQRYLNARATLNELLSLGIVPVINENGVWGIISVVLDYRGVLSDAGYIGNNDLDLLITGRNEVGSLVDIYRNHDDKPLVNPVQLAIQLPYGEWQLTAQPDEGWVAFHFHPLFWVLAFIIDAIAFYIIQLRYNNRLLEHEKIHALTTSEEKFRQFFSAHAVVMLIVMVGMLLL